MCTAVTYHTHDHYFGRNLDFEYSFPQSVVVTPRSYPLHFQCAGSIHQHHAIIGMALVEMDYPLYFDAVNEYGLCIAGLNFPGNAVYHPVSEKHTNITPYELTPWLLGQCSNVDEAVELLKNVNIVNIPFNAEIPLTPLHWIIADQYRAITVEPLEDGVKIYDNPVGVLTNNPPFDYHMHNLNNYINLTSAEPVNRFAPQINMAPYSRGMGAFGLPGDLSSSSRFVKAAFTKLNSRSEKDEASSISQFFHILDSVVQQNGCAQVGDKFERTLYSSCCNMDKGIYYYTTYENRQITGLDMHKADLNTDTLYSHCLMNTQQIRMEN